MTPEASLARGKAFLDEATENLTFDEFDWAFEETCRAVAWLLNALADSPADSLDLGPTGDLPEPGRLTALLERVAAPPEAADLIYDLEEGLEADATDDSAPPQRSERPERITELVFRAWPLHDACGRRLDVVDETLFDKQFLTDATIARFENLRFPRRTALKLIAAGSLLPLQAACKPLTGSAKKPQARTASSADNSARKPAKPRSVTPLGGMHFRTSDPFLFCAHHFDAYPEGNQQMGPATSLQGRNLGRDFNENQDWRMYHGRQVPGFPRHPHRGFETVTVVRTGRLDHSDSMGATARYGGGDVQWLTAGGGIQHAEMFPLLEDDRPNPLELFQIWLNLSADDKMVDPHFKMLWSEDIPRIADKDASGKITELTLAAGSYRGEGPPAPPPNSWASRDQSDLAIWSLRLQAGARFELPAVHVGTERSLYVHRGSGLHVADTAVPNARRVEVDGHGPLTLENGPAETEILLLQGRPIGEPIAKRGPFVMNSQDEIRQAYQDYRRTQFGGWPWPDNDPVHQRHKGRFARHIDGTFEKPT